LSEEKHETVGKLEVRGWRLEAIGKVEAKAKVEEVGDWTLEAGDGLEGSGRWRLSGR
jgi:hypothetical protein